MDKDGLRVSSIEKVMLKLLFLTPALLCGAKIRCAKNSDIGHGFGAWLGVSKL